MFSLAYVKYGGIVVAMLALFTFGYRQGGLSSKAALEADRAAQLQALAMAYQTQELARRAKESAYEHEIEQLKTDSLSFPTVAVRLCPSAANPVLPSTRQGRQDLPAGAGVLPAVPIQNSPGTDVGPALFVLADQADAIVARCRTD